MNSQELAKVKQVRLFVRAIAKNFRVEKEFSRPVINTDLVPRFSGKMMRSSFVNERPVQTAVAPVKKNDMQKLVQPIRHVKFKPGVAPAPAGIYHQTRTSVQGDYGKLSGLLADASVSSIECSGPGQNINVIRAGQKQFTKISLTPGEIKDFLEDVAMKARVPLLEGVFRAAVDNFVVNAVVSESIGSRFIIRKQTPYSMLEKQQGF